MRRLSLLPVAALAVTLALACSEPTSPPPATQVATPSFAAATARRFTVPFFNTFTDASSDLTAVFGITAEQLAAACAGGDFTQDEVTVVEVTRPDGSLKVTVHGNNLTVLIYSGGFEDVCELAGRTPLATGTAKVTQTDNDFFISGNRTNSFGLSLIGRAASDETGARFLVRGRFRTTISKQGLQLVRTIEFSIRAPGH